VEHSIFLNRTIRSYEIVEEPGMERAVALRMNVQFLFC
jgi:hypothetical protein